MSVPGYVEVPVPPHIVEAARAIEQWFAARGMAGWFVEGVADRRLLEAYPTKPTDQIKAEDLMVLLARHIGPRPFMLIFADAEGGASIASNTPPEVTAQAIANIHQALNGAPTNVQPGSNARH